MLNETNHINYKFIMVQECSNATGSNTTGSNDTGSNATGSNDTINATGSYR